jgi:hypothetical protein
MKASERWGMIGSGALIAMSFVALASGPGPLVALPLLLGGLGVGWRLLPGFWRTIFSGVASGIVAGVLVLGPGLRLAMRVVAILDPVRIPDFTWEGTFFIVVFAGGLSGVLFGALAALMRRRASARTTVTVVVVILMGLLLLPGELRTEFMELGAGPLVNIPLFTVVAMGFAAVLLRLIGRLDKRKRIQHATPVARVPG